MEASLRTSLVVSRACCGLVLGIRTRKYTAVIHNNAVVSQPTSEALSAKGFAAFATAEGTMPRPMKETLRGRVCNRAGCGQLIVGKDRSPRYDRNFCSSQCRRADKRERMQEKRRKAKSGTCPNCGRQMVEGLSGSGPVTGHKPSPAIDTQTVDSAGQEGRTGQDRHGCSRKSK
jgi:hypothetical protein